MTRGTSLRSQEQKQTRRWGEMSTNLLSDTVEPDKELEDADMYMFRTDA